MLDWKVSFELQAHSALGVVTTNLMKIATPMTAQLI